MSVLIVIPIYDEAPTIEAVVRGAALHGPVLVVDDGSTDESAAIASRAGAEVVRHPRRLGKGQALRTGLACARARGASTMLTLDGDGQHDPGDIATLLDAAERSPRTVVIGCRLGRGLVERDRAALPSGRLNAIRISGFFTSWLSEVRVDDTQSGFRAYPIALFDDVRPRAGGFVFETEVLLDAAARGWSIVEVPVKAIPRVTRRSRFRPLLDGAAIASCLGWRVVRRWGTELRAGGRELLSVVGPERRRARHAAVLERARPYAGSLPTWGLAVGAGVADCAIDRLANWWAHPRLRRDLLVGRGTVALPLVVGAALLQAALGRFAPDVVSPLVDRFWCSARLDDAARVEGDEGSTEASRLDAARGSS